MTKIGRVPEKLLSTREAAEILNVSMKTLRRRVEGGDIVVIHVGRIIRMARGPQGRKVLAQAQKAARSPQGRRLVAKAEAAARDPENRARLAASARALITRRR